MASTLLSVYQITLVSLRQYKQLPSILSSTLIFACYYVICLLVEDAKIAVQTGTIFNEISKVCLCYLRGAIIPTSPPLTFLYQYISHSTHIHIYQLSPLHQYQIVLIN